MATSEGFIHYVCEQIAGVGAVRYRKMFGEYLVYVDEKPILLVCDNTVFVKKLDPIHEKMVCADNGFPYDGAKEHYVLDIDDAAFCKEIVAALLPVVPVSNPMKKKLPHEKPPSHQK